MKRILLLFTLALVSTLVSSCKNSTNNESESHPSVDIEANSTLQSPVQLHINSEGIWKAFEGELGTVSLIDLQGNELATAIMKSEDGNWMTSEPAPFIATLDFINTEVQEGKLVFKNNFISAEGGNSPQEFEIPVIIGKSDAKLSKLTEGSNTWCFAEKTTAMNSQTGNYFNYQFLKVAVDSKNNVVGWILSAPFGTDGMRGHVSGKYNPDSSVLDLNQKSLGEGELYEQSRSFRIIENSLQLDYGTSDNKRASLNRLDCDDFDAMYKSFQNEIIAKRINTIDRTRLVKIENLKEVGYTEKELENLRFMELETDLDNNYKTREYLIYLMDSMLCGTGGCSLYVVDEKGKTLSYMTVTKLPIYTTIPTATEQQENIGNWRDLFVWSNGAFRQLKHDGKAYPSNPSLEPTIEEMELTFHPEKYRILLEYLD